MRGFSKRTDEKEIMDDPNMGSADLSAVLKDVNIANRLLGGNRGIRKALKSVLRKLPNKSISLLDIGCGDGTTLRKLARYLENKGYTAHLYGLDLSEKAIQIAGQSSHGYPQISYFCGDALRKINNIPRCDVVISTLTMHHIDDRQLANFLEGCQQYSKKAVIINDLERSPLAYYLFQIFGAIFIKTAIAKNDGLISIRKGFLRRELETLSLNYEDWDHYISWNWAFRYVWVMERKRLKHQ